jgi:hypothetical protein
MKIATGIIAIILSLALFLRERTVISLFSPSLASIPVSLRHRSAFFAHCSFSLAAH